MGACVFIHLIPQKQKKRVATYAEILNDIKGAFHIVYNDI